MVERNWDNIINLVRAVENAPSYTFDLNDALNCALGAYRKCSAVYWPFADHFGFTEEEYKWLFYCEDGEYQGPTLGYEGKLYFFKLLRKVLGL